MSELIPENMDEVKLKMARMLIDGHQVTEEEVIYQAVADLFQDYLEEAEEGHYDTSHLNGDTFTVTGISGSQIAEFKSTKENFVEDFRHDALELCFRLEDEAQRIARL
ncbi:MAG: hypothetical protein M3005_02060 [Apilactobacillus sp.]|uniref:DNA-packaging protein n=1 Tax=Apilactobacillus apinorum TaxID=1218495 RepID=A0ABP9ZIB1_9LACO|nr:MULTISPECIES: hypothetical protein [Apilactobacillus]KOY68477.1 uncharacterized protein RZ74_10290 [Apilactobacillus apinorum]MCT6822634.1 hypothetical protein [Apilactobacillus sp.]MCT6858201.1 hypothetical protein [Apilactobacillus sp.]CAI2686745.1 Putative uncharacterized protein [Apilactobacillus apinorum]